MQFVDKARIVIKAGDGGDGCASFHREKFVTRGGPDGGDGGRGGNVVFVADSNMDTLLDFKFARFYRAENGEKGRAARSSGKNGQDLIIKVPVGTLVRDVETGAIAADLNEPGRRKIVLHGGRGGKGNSRFATPSKQAPRFAQPGQKTLEREVELELKTIADVGLIGLPNVGKSTILSVLTSAKPKIANYHFTTLTPVLGVVKMGEGNSFVMADIPGIIEGASEGKGLGLRFLRHIERNSLLLFMVPGDTDDIRKEYEILLNELATFNPEMLDKQRVLAITKSDMLDEELIAMLEPTLPDNVPHIFISSVTGLGIQQLKDILWTELNKDSNKLEGVRTETIVHRAKDVAKLQEELKDMGEDEDFEYKYEEDADDDFDYEYEDEDWDEEEEKK